MSFLKKFFLIFIAAILIFAGGSGTQSHDILTQGGGLVAIIAGLVVLYIFGKLVWKAMGCLPSFMFLAGICFFILYAIGAFNDGFENIIPNLQRFMGFNNKTSSLDDFEDVDTIKLEEDDAPTINISENFDSPEPLEKPETINQNNESKMQPEQISDQEEGGIKGFFSNLLGTNDTADQQNFNPKNYPAVRGNVTVVSGDTLVMRRHFIRLFGIDAPEKNQICSNSQGRSYACGKEATRWLHDWLQDNEIECHVLKQNSKGNVIAVCSLGEYDIGAALVSSGWAVSLPNNTIYPPYEQQAQRAHRGMWQGKFYKPWDWIKFRSAKPKIKINKPKVEKKTKRLWDFL